MRPPRRPPRAILKRLPREYNLFTTYFKSSSPERDSEYKQCIAANKKVFKQVFLLVQEQDAAEAETLGCKVFVYENRPTFEDFFKFLMRPEFSKSANVVANTDIYFESLKQLTINVHRLTPTRCFALTRYNWSKDGKHVMHKSSGSQDTWIFAGNSNLHKIKNVSFTMGLPGCDNRLAHELTRAGFKVVNPCLSIKTIHLHNVPERTYSKKDTVPGPHLNLKQVK